MSFSSLLEGSGAPCCISGFACNRLLRVVGASIGGKVITRPPRTICTGSFSSLLFSGSAEAATSTATGTHGAGDVTEGMVSGIFGSSGVFTTSRPFAGCEHLAVPCPSEASSDLSKVVDNRGSGIEAVGSTRPTCNFRQFTSMNEGLP